MVNYLDHLGTLKNTAAAIIDFPINTIDVNASAARPCVKNYCV